MQKTTLSLDSKDGEISCISQISDHVLFDDDILHGFSQTQQMTCKNICLKAKRKCVILFRVIQQEELHHNRLDHPILLKENETALFYLLHEILMKIL